MIDDDDDDDDNDGRHRPRQSHSRRQPKQGRGQGRAVYDTLIGARLVLQEAEQHWQMADNALAIATAERALQQAKIRGAVVYFVYVFKNSWMMQKSVCPIKPGIIQ